MRLTAKNAFINIIYYGVTVIALPAIFLLGESLIGIRRHPGLVLKIAGAMLILSGAALQAWCIVLFQRIGLGTPSPAVPTARLVIVGPYRYVRNPMNIGEIAVFLGWLHGLARSCSWPMPWGLGSRSTCSSSIGKSRATGGISARRMTNTPRA